MQFSNNDSNCMQGYIDSIVLSVICQANHSHSIYGSDRRLTVLQMSAEGLGLKTWAKTVKSLSSVLSALSSVLSDPAMFHTGGFPPS